MPRHMEAFDPALVELNGRTECNGIAWNQQNKRSTRKDMNNFLC